MADKKRQHYVPRFYMREFADSNKKFSVLNLKTGERIEKVSYSSQCYKDYYYGSDGIWEEQLGEMENKWADVIRSILSYKALTTQDITLIKQFILYQRQRTYAEGEYLKQSRKETLVECAKMLYANKGWKFDEEAMRVCEERAAHDTTPAENLERAIGLTEFLEDLETTIITYKTNNELISSDTPVISINPFHKFTIGYGCMGLIMLVPISSHTLVVVYDSKMYTQFRGQQYIEIHDDEEVNNLNILQYISAEKILFASRLDELNRFGEKEKELRNTSRNRKAISTLGPGMQKMMTYGMRLTLYDHEFSFGHLGRQYRRIPFACREAAPRKWEKEWEEKLLIKPQIMSKIIEIDPQMLINIGLSKKDLIRGYRKIANSGSSDHAFR